MIMATYQQVEFRPDDRASSVDAAHVHRCAYPVHPLGRTLLPFGPGAQPWQHLPCLALGER